jgi:hypothetical protein
MDKFKDLTKQLKGAKCWGKETHTVVDAYVAKITSLGYDIANDTLTDLLKLAREQIKENVKHTISGITPGTPRENTSEIALPQEKGLPQNEGLTQNQTADAKMGVTVDTLVPTQIGAEGISVVQNTEQEERKEERPSTGSDPAFIDPPAGQESRPPDKGTEDLTKAKNLS